MRRLATTAVLLTAVCTPLFFAKLAAAQEQPLLYTVPFKAGDDGYLIFRIPAIWTAPGKPLLAFAEGRITRRGAAGNIDVVLRRSFDGGQTWEPMQIVADQGEDFCGNPCVVRDPSNGRIWLAFTRSPGKFVEAQIAEGKAPPTLVWITHSDDDGATWSKPIDISATARKSSWGWYGTGPGLGLYLGDDKKGRILIPSYHSDGGVYRTHCIYSDDHGATWKLGAIAADNSSEPQVVVMNDGSLLMNARTIADKGDHRTLLSSRDRGETWQPVKDAASIPENLCQGCVYRLPRPEAAKPNRERRFDLLYAQPADKKRRDVEVWLSDDNGKSWPHKKLLWRGPSAYTAMTHRDGTVYLLVECGQKDTHAQIAFLKFSPDWFR